jgi:hypothetical protein
MRDGASGNNSISAAGDTAASKGETLCYSAGTGADSFAGGFENDTIVAGNATLNAGDAISGGSGANALMLSGGGTFNLTAPTTLTNIQTVDAAEGQAAGGGAPNGVQTVDLRDGLNQTVNVASGTPSPLDPNPETITINGAANNDVINLGTGTDTVVLGGTGEMVNGGGGIAFIESTTAFAGALVNGTAGGTTTLNITNGGTATLNANDSHLTVDLTAATNLTLSKMSFITAEGSGGNDVIIAGAAGQVLTGGGGQDILEDGGQYGITFQDTVAGFLGDTLVGFSKVDTIDITNLFSVPASPIYDGTYGASSSGLLAVANGSGFVDINLSGLTAGGSFNAASDNHGGTLITYS